MFSTLRQVLRYENKLVLEMKSKGLNTVRPSTVVIWIVGVLYLLSSIDIIPEAIVKPKAIGYIDDLIVITIFIIMTGNDLGGIIDYVFGKVPAIRIPERKERTKPDEVPTKVQRDESNVVSLCNANSSNSSSSNSESAVGSPAVPTNISNGNDATDSKDDEFDDQEFFSQIAGIIGTKPKDSSSG